MPIELKNAVTAWKQAVKDIPPTPITKSVSEALEKMLPDNPSVVTGFDKDLDALEKVAKIVDGASRNLGAGAKGPVPNLKNAQGCLRDILEAVQRQILEYKHLRVKVNAELSKIFQGAVDFMNDPNPDDLHAMKKAHAEYNSLFTKFQPAEPFRQVPAKVLLLAEGVLKAQKRLEECQRHVDGGLDEMNNYLNDHPSMEA
jgi:hypothetical protein